MNAVNLLVLVLAFIILAASLGAFFASLELFFPARIARTRQILSASPGRSLLVGLINLLFLAGVCLLLLQLADRSGGGAASLLAILAAAILLVAVSFGLAGVVSLTAERILSGRILSGRGSLARTFAASALLSLGCAFPLAGWFGLLPFLLCYGLGGFILSLFNREAPPAVP